MPDRPPVALVRSEPYRILFPLGFVLGAIGVGHWVLFATGALGNYLAMFHAVTQTQAFLLAFAAGFLMTAVPKRTETPPATRIELAAMIALPPTVSGLTLLGYIAVGQLAYAAALIVLAAFAIRRFLSRTAGRKPPTSFALVPIGFACGLGGAVLIAIGSQPDVPVPIYTFGRALAFEGVFSCLVLGIASFFLPLAMRGAAAPDYDGTPRAKRALAGYAAAGFATVAGLALELGGNGRAGLALRALAAGSVLVASGAWHRPTRPGPNRWLLWAALWGLPIGLVLAALFPDHRIAAMHVAFIGGFGLLAFAVAAHVTVAHGGTPERRIRPWPVVGFGALFVCAMVLRAIATALGRFYVVWVGVAAALWLAGALLWAAVLLPRLWRRPIFSDVP